MTKEEIAQMLEFYDKEMQGKRGGGLGGLDGSGPVDGVKRRILALERRMRLRYSAYRHWEGRNAETGSHWD